MVACNTAQQTVVGCGDIVVLVYAYACKGRHINQETSFGRNIGHKVRIKGVYAFNQKHIVLAKTHLGFGKLTYSAFLEIETGRPDAFARKKVFKLLVKERQVYCVQ